MSNQQPKVRITFSKVYVTKNSEMPNSAKVGYAASLDGKPVPAADNITGEYDTTPSKYLSIFRKSAVHELGWSDEIPISLTKNSIEVSLTCFDATFEKLGLVGTAIVKINYPYVQGRRRVKADNGAFLLEYNVELFAKGSFSRHPPKTLFASRQNTGAATATTVSGRKQIVRLEFHPVCPTPKKGLPDRPRLSFWERMVNIQKHDLSAATISATAPLNIIKNPVVIPVLTPALPPRAGKAAPTNAQMDGSGAANERNVARIEFSWCYPKDLKFTDDDERLEWKVTPAHAPVKFLGKPNGTKVKVYATDATVDEVVLEVYLKGAKVGTYRALIKKSKKVPCRFNILKNKDSNDANDSPASGPAQILQHLAMVNRILRQCGLELELHTSRATGLDMTGAANKKLLAPDDSEISNGLKYETKILQDGIFEIRVPQGLTFNADDPAQADAAKMNARENVVNFAYINSGDPPEDIGYMAWYARNPAANSYNESGNPSSSWKSRSGAQYVPGNQAAPCDAVNMVVGSGDQPGTETKIYGICIIDRAHSSATEFANTIAHEFGHALGLDHRYNPSDTEGDLPDGLGYPFEENLMHWSNPATIAQDVDIVQAKVMHQSPVVP